MKMKKAERATAYSTVSSICLSWHLINGISLLGRTTWCGHRYGYTVVDNVHWTYILTMFQLHLVSLDTQTSVKTKLNSDG